MPETPDIRWGAIDRALALVSPRAAARRYAARVALGNMRRAYDAAEKGRRTEHQKRVKNREMTRQPRPS